MATDKKGKQPEPTAPPRHDPRWIVLAPTILGVAVVLLAAAIALRQSSLTREIAALKAGQAALQNDLSEVKTLLRRQPAGQAAAPLNPVVSIADARAKGRPDAALTLVEFSDYQ